MPGLMWEFASKMRVKGITPIGLLGGANGPTPSMVISRDLVNATHVDPGDNGMSCSFWTELQEGSAKNWYLLFPHVEIDHNHYRYTGLAIRLFRGCFVA